MWATTHGPLTHCVSTNPSIATCPPACRPHLSSHLPIHSHEHASTCPEDHPLIHPPPDHHPLTRMPPSHAPADSSVYVFIHSCPHYCSPSFLFLSRSGSGPHKSPAHKALWGALVAPVSSHLLPFSPAGVIRTQSLSALQPLLSSRLAGDHNVLPHPRLPLKVSKSPSLGSLKISTVHDCKEERSLSLQGLSTVSVPSRRAAHLPEHPSTRALADRQHTERKLPLSGGVGCTVGAPAIRFL